MFGPKIDGGQGTSLRPPVREDYDISRAWQLEPEATRFWGPRYSWRTPEQVEESFKRDGTDPNAINWTIAYHDEPVGFTGIFHIDWIARDGETGIFIGRHDLYGRGIASEAIRLRMAYIWNELGLHRTHNWIALPNEGSWRANQKSGYTQIGTYPNSWHRSGEWVNEWLGEAFPHRFPADKLPMPWKKDRASKE